MAKKKQSELQKAVEITKKFQSNVKLHVATAISAAFGFLIALYWKDIIVDSVDQVLLIFDLKQDALLVKLFAALIVTGVAVLGIYFFSRWSEKK